MQEILRRRIRAERGEELLMSAAEAAGYIEDGMVLGVSGFTPSDYPKLIPRELVKRVENGEKLQVDIYSGATVGTEIDTEMVRAGMIRKRLPFCNNADIREAINRGELSYLDMHLSQSGQAMDYGFLRPIDLAIVEVIAITEEGDLIPSIAVGNTAAVVKNAKQVLVEIAMKKPLELEGMHDIYFNEKPPARKAIPIINAADRIGSKTIPCGWEKIRGIVISEAEDHTRPFVEPDPVSVKISQHLIRFLENEIREGRMPKKLLPLQSGIGNVANAVLAGLKEGPFEHLQAYTEIIQDGMLELMECGKLDFASATCLSLSAEGFQKLYRNLDFFKDKILLRPEEISNHPEVIRRLGVVSMNTAIEADIYGNVNSSHIMGSRMMNGIGGSGDFSRNAYLSIFTTPSTAKEGAISAIVPMVSHVDHTEHEVMVLVTEQGYADLRGLSPKERAEVIIEKCAHPDYRPMLREYLEDAGKTANGQHTPHNLRNAFSWHQRYLETGSMRKKGRKEKAKNETAE